MTEKKEVYNKARFKEIEKYPEFSPADFREKLKKFPDLEKKIDDAVDIVYDLQQRLKFYTAVVGMRELELKCAVLGGLTKEEIEKYDKLMEIKYEPRLQSVQ